MFREEMMMDSETFEPARAGDRMVLSDHDFRFFQSLIFDLAGISLSAKKIDLVSSRLGRHIKKAGLRSFGEYRTVLENAVPGGAEIQTFINLLTTNKTEFFREEEHFNYMSNVLIPTWIDARKKNVLVWSCASSTGEEPYTLSLVLNRGLTDKIPYRILATDIDTGVLSTAEQGVYRDSRLAEIPSEYRDKNVRSGSGTATGWFRVENHIHDKVVFKHHNLIENTYPGDEKFDVVFCRNVLIYFSSETIRTLMEKLYRSLKPGGVLFIGHTEAISGCEDLFRSVHPAVFEKI